MKNGASFVRVTIWALRDADSGVSLMARRERRRLPTSPRGRPKASPMILCNT